MFKFTLKGVFEKIIISVIEFKNKLLYTVYNIDINDKLLVYGNRKA
jgi:hypothetical protein